jgi:hypothetical protein
MNEAVKTAKAASLPDLPADTTTKCAVTYHGADLVAITAVAIVVSVWAAVAGKAYSVGVLLGCEALLLAYYLTGSLFSGWARVSAGVLFDLPLRLLVGYAVVNTALLVLAFVSPLGVIANFGLLFAVIIAVFVSRRPFLTGRAHAASYAVIALGLLATTLWYQDSIQPFTKNGNVVVFKPWVDGFYHAVHVRIFAESHGAATIEDFRMTGVPARPYHYGMYLSPAFVQKLSGIHSYASFAGILSPLGGFFTGLGAYALFGSLFGAWPGFAAAAALLLLPDGFRQGLANPFMSYHWLTQISPSATYGLAILAVAWLFVLTGCRRSSPLQVLIGWGFAGVLVAYKLHYVVASAFLLLVVPAVFFARPLGKKLRALWIFSAAAFYVAALYLGQKVPGVPLIRFDGSAMGEILHLILTFAVPGPFKEFLTSHLGRPFPWTKNLLLGLPYVLATIFGLLLPLCVGLVVWLRKRLPALYLAFPLLLIANFAVMFFGLALDFESSTPDELSHRPLMIVYFFVAAWIGGALGVLAVESERLRRNAHRVIVGASAALLVVPLYFGQGVQLMWAMPRLSPFRVPAPLLEVADFLRTHGGPEDVFQDCQFDRTYTIAAWSERRSFVSHTLTNMPFRGETLAKRTAAVDRLMMLRDEKLIVGTARAYGIRWFILQKGSRVNWPPQIADHPAFEAGPFRVYEF